MSLPSTSRRPRGAAVEGRGCAAGRAVSSTRVCVPPAVRRLPRLQAGAQTAGQTASAPAEASVEGPLQYGVATAQGPRSEMEDAATVVPRGACDYLYAFVFDGHSGGEASAWLEQNMYDIIGEVLRGVPEDAEAEVSAEGLACPLTFRTTLFDSFGRADERLLQYLAGLPTPEERSAGSTATVGLVRRDKLVIANVGDSRAVLCRGGRAQDLSVEHRVHGRSPAVAKEVARVEAGGGWVADGRVCDILSVSRAFGDSLFKGEGLRQLLQHGIDEGFWDEAFAAGKAFSADPVTVEPDVVQAAVQADDEFLILATDGLWDVFSSDDAVQLARRDLLKGASCQDVAEKLVDRALKRYTADNVAAVVVDLGITAMAGSPKKKGGGLFGGMFG